MIVETFIISLLVVEDDFSAVSLIPYPSSLRLGTVMDEDGRPTLRVGQDVSSPFS